MSTVDLARDLWLLLAAQGLNLAVGHAGQPVLGQGAFVAAGAYGVLLLAGWPLGLAVVAVVAGAALLGWCVDYGASRLRGPFLALGTWALAWLAIAIVQAFPGIFGGAQGLVKETPIALESRWLGARWELTPRTHVGLALACCALAMLATWWLRRGPLGLDLAALRDSPAAAEASGVRVAGLRRGTFAAAAALGALAGAGTSLLLGVVAPSDVSPLLSVQLFVAVLLGGTASVWGPAFGVAVVVALPSVADWLADLTGMPPDRSRGVLTAALLIGALALRGPLTRRLPRRRTRPVDLPEPAPPDTWRGEVALEARGVTRSYGALRVLDGVDLTLRASEVHALIGPNGSGKTTLLRVLSGAVPADAGTVDARGRVVRTFQRTVLFPELTVAEHIAVGARAREPYQAWRVLLATPRARAAHRAAAAHVAAALDVSGLAGRGGARPEQLDQGEQRLLQVARAAATGARVLLLDEPAAGMAPDAVRRLTTVVRTLAGNGVAVLLVEHDMRFVASVADWVTVLAEGRVLASNTPTAIRHDAGVRKAYLGET